MNAFASCNRLTMTDPDNNTQTYVYDANNRLASTTAPGAGTTAYVYDALGRVARQDNGNGTYVLNTFDAAGRITLLKNRKSDNSLLSSFAYTVDNVGNRLSITESVLGTDNATYQNATVNYGYDNIYRLTSEHRTGYTPFWYEYQYDGAGNRLALVQKDGAGNITGTTNSTYDAANKLLTSGNITYTWDANGNQTSKTVNGQTTNYAWDYENKMTSLTSPGATMNFATDGEGFRRSLNDGSNTTRFVYDRSRSRGTPGIDPLISEADATGVTTARYVHSNGLVSQTRGGTTLWYAYEAIGTTRQLTDNSQGVTDSYTLEAFGNMAASTGSSLNPYKYVGRYGYHDDGQSGLMLLGVRYFDGAVGRFSGEDPIRDQVNWYEYCWNNPAIHTDPTGESIKSGFCWTDWKTREAGCYATVAGKSVLCTALGTVCGIACKATCVGLCAGLTGPAAFLCLAPCYVACTRICAIPVKICMSGWQDWLDRCLAGAAKRYHDCLCSSGGVFDPY